MNRKQHVHALKLNQNMYLTTVMFTMQRNYDVSLPHKKIPDTLCQLAKRLATPAMPLGEEFQPEGAIVNYFGPGITKKKLLILADF